MTKRRLLIVLAIIAITASIWSYVLLTNPSATLDQRVHDVASQLRCLICQGESVADSPSLLAQEMRGVIRQKLQSGESEQEVIAYFQNRYGNRILLTPQWQGFQLLAWLVPIGMLLIGAILLFYVLRTWRTAPVRLSTSENIQSADNTDESGEEDDELGAYREQLERELAADDPIFAHSRGEMEAS